MAKLEKKIELLLQKEDKKWTFEEIEQALSLEEDSLPTLKSALESLQLQGKIYLTDHQEYIPFPKDNALAVGEVRYDCRHRPFVLVGRNMVYVPEDHLNGALKGDIVVVKRNAFIELGENKSIIDQILKRQNNTIIFECRKKNGRKIIRPYNSPFSFRVSLSKKDRDSLQDGDRFFVEIDTINHNGNFHGDIICMVGHREDVNLDVKTIAASHGIHIEFPEDVLEEAEQIPLFVSADEIQEELQKGRVDLRKKEIFTIDGRKSKDLDDAISLEINERGNFLLGVHIADVSHYVKEGSKLQQEAFKRGHSYYFLNLVFPMLPSRLSNGICSLNPYVDRLTKSCELEITPEGKILSYRVFPSIICSKKKMAYEDVNQIFEEGKMVEGYESFIPTLKRMFQLSSILDRKKHQRGYITFGDKDFIIHTDEKGLPTHITPIKRGVSEKLIENFMLVANEAVANYSSDLHLEEEHLPYIYRIHGLPDKARIREVLTYLIESGYSLENKNYENPKEFQELLESLSGLDAYPAISDILIRGLSKAKYSIENLGHFGLALSHYTHFTSPIRRYSDLQTHYNINTYESNNRHILDPEVERQKMIEVCKHTTMVEKIADSTDQEITSYKLAQFMKDKEGEEFLGMITYISKNHVIVKTKDYVTGTLSTQELLDLGYELWHGTTLVEKATNRRLRIGDFIQVRLEEVNLETHKIRFSLASKREKTYVKKGA